jgi:cytochrome o ubiquinol oxidase subunit 2
VRHFADVTAGLFNLIVNMCVEPGKMCQSQMMAIDRSGGLGLAGISSILPRELAQGSGAPHGAVFGAAPGYVTGACSTQERAEAKAADAPAPAYEPIVGAGLPRPPLMSRTYPISLQIASPRPPKS